MEQALEVQPTSIAMRERADLKPWDRQVAAAQARTQLEIELIEPGALVPYHEGHLAFDQAKNPEVAGIAVAFYQAATDQGLGVLVQRRIDRERCQYLFRRHSTPK